MRGQTGFRQIILPLAVAQTLIWAGIFYSFPALLLQWEADPGWSKIELSGAFSLALVTCALLAPVVGRLIDDGFGQRIFTSCTVLGGLLLAALSRVDALWQFYLVWAGIGAAMSGALYEPCFAVLTRAMGASAKRAITTVTLFAGFAGALSFPLFNVLSDWLGWRNAVLIVSLILLLIAPWLVWRATGAAEQLSYDSQKPRRSSTGMSLRHLRRPSFWLLGISFAMIALDHGILITHILPLLNERGVHRETAIFAAAMIGPMQVAGRLAMMAVESQLSTFIIAQLSFVVMGLAALALLGSAAVPLLLVGFVVLHGSGYGVTSITRPVVIAEFLGHRDYGVIAGMLATLYLLTAAAAPTIASLVWQWRGYDGVIYLMLAATGVGLICLLAAAKFRTDINH
jgi:predicted MFS family arabinose efflux permease